MTGGGTGWTSSSSSSSDSAPAATATRGGMLGAGKTQATELEESRPGGEM